MPARFHADDLGLHASVDRAIFRAFEAGALAGASILTTGPTFRQAAAQARSLELPLSLHLAIVDTEPLSRPSEVPSLLGQDGRFPSAYPEVVRRALLGRLRRTELKREIRRQLGAFADAGLIGPGGLVTDGHQHLHLLPSVFAVLLEQADDFALAGFRVPVRSPAERRQRGRRSLMFAVAEKLGRRHARVAAARGIAAVPCWGIVFAGRLTLRRARAVLDSLPPTADGQIICHPGDDDRALAAERDWGYAWETELATVLQLGRASR